MQSVWLPSGAIGVFAGTSIATLLPSQWWWMVLPIGLGMVCLRLPRAVVIGALLIGVSIGGARATYVRQLPDQLAPYAQTTTSIEGVIVSEGDLREAGIRYRMKVKSVDGRLTEGVLLVTTPLHEHLPLFGTVTVRGLLETPEPFATDTGRTFNYPMWLLKDGITATMQFPIIESVAPYSGIFSLRLWLSNRKAAFIESLQMLLPEPHASLGAGLLLGARHTLGEDVLETFRRTGLSHIVVLSGYNLSIIADAISRGAIFVPALTALCASAIMIVLFAITVGGGATVVRASIMALIALVARYTGRTYGAMRALWVAAALMVLHSPLIALYDPGFQLSFLATLSLVLLSGRIEERLSWLARVPTLRAIAASTIAAQVGVLPLLLYLTGTISIISFPANLAVLPLIPLAMALVFGAGLFGFAIPAVGIMVAIGAYFVLTLILWLDDSFAAFPGAILELSPGVLPLVLTVYLIAAAVWWRK